MLYEDLNSSKQDIAKVPSSYFSMKSPYNVPSSTLAPHIKILPGDASWWQVVWYITVPASRREYIHDCVNDLSPWILFWTTSVLLARLDFGDVIFDDVPSFIGQI